MVKTLFFSVLVLLVSGCSQKEHTLSASTSDNQAGAYVAEPLQGHKLIEQQEEILKRQEIQIEKQKRELEDLQRQKIYNEKLKQYE